MPHTVTASDLAHMTDNERRETLDRLACSASGVRNGQAALIEARIRNFEKTYEMTSEAMRAALRSGSQKETAEIVLWLFWLRARDDRQ